MKTVIAAAFVAAAATICAGGAQAQTGLLGQIKSKGVVTCGVGPGLAGFGIPDAQGVWSGLDVDLCKGIAAAIFNDPNKVKYIPLSSKDRFTALQSGEVDLLSRNTTWTMSRDTSLGLNFAGVNYYDGQGFMVRKKLGVDLGDAAQRAPRSAPSRAPRPSSTSPTIFRANNLKYEVVAFATSDETDQGL